MYNSWRAEVGRVVSCEAVRPANDAVIYKTELRLVLSSARSLFCLNIRSFGNVAADASPATSALALSQNIIFFLPVYLLLEPTKRTGFAFKIFVTLFIRMKP